MAAPKTGRHTEKDLPVALHNWALKEMHFRAAGKYVNRPLPTVEDFAEICKGEMADIWQFVIKNIYSAQTVRKVQGNLLLKQKKSVPYVKAYKVKYGSGEHFNEEKAKSIDRRRLLIAEITSTRANVGILEKDLAHIQTELSDVEQNYEDTVSHIRELNHKTAILHVHSQRIQREVNELDEYKKRLAYIIKNLKDKSGVSAGEERASHHVIMSSESGRKFESATTEDVKACCELVCTFLHEMLQGSFGTDTAEMGQHKNRLWTKVESAVGTHSPRQIMNSLSLVARESAYDLKNKTAKIDIKKDAEILRFKYEGEGQLTDLSSQPSLLKSIHQLLEDHQMQQIRNFLQTEDYHNKSVELEQRLSHLLKLRDTTLAECFAGQDARTLELARSVFDTELQIAFTRAAIVCLDTYRESLKEKIHLALREKETLYQKYQKIQGFKKMADGKQNLIRVLVKQNLSARRRLENQQAEMTKLAERSFKDQAETMKQLSTRLKDSVKNEIDVFARLALPNLLFTVMDSAYRVALIDLSINRLSANRNTTSGQVIKQILKALEFPPYKAPEELLTKVNELLSEAEDMESKLRSESHPEENQKRSEQSDKALVHKLNDLNRESAEHDQRQLEQLLPLLQRRLTDISHALTDCLHVKDMVQEWWEQPAQNTVPWVKVDDKSLQQWKDYWTVTVARLRQLEFQ